MPWRCASSGWFMRHTRPRTRISPWSGRITPAMIFISVDLPAPFSPMTAWTVPRAQPQRDVVERHHPGEGLAHIIHLEEAGAGRVSHDAALLWNMHSTPDRAAEVLSRIRMTSRSGNSLLGPRSHSFGTGRSSWRLSGTFVPSLDPVKRDCGERAIIAVVGRPCRRDQAGVGFPSNTRPGCRRTRRSPAAPRRDRASRDRDRRAARPVAAARHGRRRSRGGGRVAAMRARDAAPLEDVACASDVAASRRDGGCSRAATWRTAGDPARAARYRGGAPGWMPCGAGAARAGGNGRLSEMAGLSGAAGGREGMREARRQVGSGCSRSAIDPASRRSSSGWPRSSAANGSNEKNPP